MIQNNLNQNTLRQPEPTSLDSMLSTEVPEHIKNRANYIISNFDKHHFKNVDPLIHFVWLGNIPFVSCQFIQLWESQNPDYRVTLWRLKSGVLASEILKYLIDLVSFGHFSSLFEAQNALYKHFIASNEGSLDIDSTILSFLYRINENIYDRAKKNKIELIEREQNLTTQFNIRHIDLERGLFTSRRFNLKKYFAREIVLRQNLACASDIFRLYALYEYGGIYIDSDTLPCLNKMFPNIKSFANKNREVYRLLDTYKSQVVSIEILGIDAKDIGENIKPVIETVIPDTMAAIEADDKLPRTIDQIKQLGDIVVYKDCIRLSSDRNVQGDFNNNIVATHKHSRLVRIVIREMCARYRYLEANHLIMSTNSSNSRPNPYYYRLNNYRKDGNDTGNLVTLELSGPILILEVVLGLAYELYDLEGVSQDTLGQLLHMPEFGFSYPDQTMYTYHHLNSTWM